MGSATFANFKIYEIKNDSITCGRLSDHPFLRSEDIGVDGMDKPAFRGTVCRSGGNND